VECVDRSFRYFELCYVWDGTVMTFRGVYFIGASDSGPVFSVLFIAKSRVDDPLFRTVFLFFTAFSGFRNGSLRVSGRQIDRYVDARQLLKRGAPQRLYRYGFQESTTYSTVPPSGPEYPCFPSSWVRTVLPIVCAQSLLYPTVRSPDPLISLANGHSCSARPPALPASDRARREMWVVWANLLPERGV
jgi:hypothetical protein